MCFFDFVTKTVQNFNWGVAGGNPPEIPKPNSQKNQSYLVFWGSKNQDYLVFGGLKNQTAWFFEGRKTKTVWFLEGRKTKTVWVPGGAEAKRQPCAVPSPWFRALRVSFGTSGPVCEWALVGLGPAGWGFGSGLCPFGMFTFVF